MPTSARQQQINYKHIYETLKVQKQSCPQKTKTYTHIRCFLGIWKASYNTSPALQKNPRPSGHSSDVHTKWQQSLLRRWLWLPMQMLQEIQDSTYLNVYLPVWTTLSWMDTQAKEVLLMEADSKETTSFARQKAKQSYEIAPWVVETVLLPLPANRSPQLCSSALCHTHLYHLKLHIRWHKWRDCRVASQNCSKVPVRKRGDVPYVRHATLTPWKGTWNRRLMTPFCCT